MKEMKEKDLDTRLDRRLAALQRVAASPDFTRRVLRAVDAPRPVRRPAAVVALALAATVLVVAVVMPLAPSEHSPAGAQGMSARQEIARLEQELDALRRQAAPPLVLLDAGGGRTLAVDLGRRTGEQSPSRIYAVHTVADGRITY